MRGATGCRTLPSRFPFYLPGMAPQPYYRRWTVYLRGERIGEVLAVTEQAACVRAVQRFKISREDQRALVRGAAGD